MGGILRLILLGTRKAERLYGNAETQFFPPPDGVVAGCGLIASPANALVEININKGNVEPLPIAITDFLQGELAQKISGVIAADLKRSGLFAPIDKGAFIEKISNPDATPRFEDWKVINAQALVIGRVTQEGDGRLKAEFRLWDTFAGQQMLGQQFYTQPENWRRVAHIIADAIYERITGEKGYFDTRIVYVAESGPKNARKRQLAIMDQDGANSRALTNSNDIVLTPRFSPNRQEITYMSFENQQPRVYLLQLETGARGGRQFPGHDLRPAFLAGWPAGDHEPAAGRQRQHLYDGSALAHDDAAHQHRGDRHLSLLFAGRQPDRLRKRPRRQAAALRHGRRRLRPDAHFLRRRFLFDARLVSARRPHRLHQAVGGKFSIGVMKPDGSGERILTTGFHNEGPTWAPNGRVLMFFRQNAGAGGPQLYSIDLTGYNEQLVQTQGFASDPAWSPLME